jgi:hypothetical protein
MMFEKIMAVVIGKENVKYKSRKLKGEDGRTVALPYESAYLQC